MMMEQKERRKYARQFGLPVAQVRLFAELTERQRIAAARMWSKHNTDQYVYAAKRAGGLVWNRYKIDGREVRGW